MKKTLSLILAAILLTAALASCAVAPKEAYAKIRLTSSDASDAAAWLAERLGARLTDRLRGVDAKYDALRAEHPELPDYPPEVKEQLEITVKYEGYISRQDADRRKFLKMEDTPLPADADYLNMSGLRIEARQKLDAQRPASLGQASRIPGINPGDISVLMIWLKANGAPRA